MTGTGPSVVLEIVRGPLDGTRLSATGRVISIGMTPADDISLPGSWEEATQLRLRVAGGERIEISAASAVSVNGVVIGTSASAQVGDVVGTGLAEFAVIAVSESGIPAERADEATPTPDTAPGCPRCGAPNSPGAPWCGACGRDLPAERA